MEKTFITFVRHGQNMMTKPTEKWHPGPNLTKHGRDEAKKTGEYLSSLEFDKIFSSDLNRAVQTTNIITKFIKNPDKTSVSFHRKLSEHDEILYEGKPGTRKYEIELKKAKRSIEFFKKILKEYKGKKILIVAHGNVIRACIGHAFGYSILKTPKLFLLHCSLSSLAFKGIRLKEVYYINSVSHYREMKFIDTFAPIKFKS